MLTDIYDNPIGTASPAAQSAYADAMAAYLDATPGVEAAISKALDADPRFALAHVLSARQSQTYGRMADARASIARAVECSVGLPEPTASHVSIFDDLINGRVAAGYKKVRAHLRTHPRDALAAQSCLGVFSLIGFSGRIGREAEHLSIAEELAPAYGDDGWFQAQLAFAQMETGKLKEAETAIEAARAARPRSAHVAHIRAHLSYEQGETKAGLDVLSRWMADYPRDGMMHCHNSWHVALWRLGQGDAEGMWRIVEEDLDPDVCTGPPLNILTDLASLYWRAEMAGVDVPADRWARLSAYAAQSYPNPALGFADVHAALAHAMAGDGEKLARIVEGAKGPAADIVAPCAVAFGALARGDWAEAERELIAVMASHERIGGSRAQRDLLEFSLLHAQVRQGRVAEARRLLAMRRPLTDSIPAVAALAEEPGG